jgi:hypothetical protein
MNGGLMVVKPVENKASYHEQRRCDNKAGADRPPFILAEALVVHLIV